MPDENRGQIAGASDVSSGPIFYEVGWTSPAPDDLDAFMAWLETDPDCRFVYGGGGSSDEGHPGFPALADRYRAALEEIARGTLRPAHLVAKEALNG